MTWQEYALSRQYLLEERIGTRVRESQAAEDELFGRSKKAIKGVR
jgi:hypothetical protein